MSLPSDPGGALDPFGPADPPPAPDPGSEPVFTAAPGLSAGPLAPVWPPPGPEPAQPASAPLGWRGESTWQGAGPPVFLAVTTAVRNGPIVHPRSASWLLGLAAACAIGALLATAQMLAGLLRADPAVRRLGAQDDSGSSAAGFLVIGLIFLAIGAAIERRWLQRLAALRPPPIASSSAPPERTVRRLAIGSRLVAVREMWASAPDPTFDLVARSWTVVVWVTVILGALAAIEIAAGDGQLVRDGLGLALVAEWLLILVTLVGWALVRRLGRHVERRAIFALIGRPDEPVRPDWRFARSGLLVVPLLANLLVGSTAWALVAGPDRSACPAFGPDCHLVTVPFDRTRPDDPRTIDIAYRVARSTGGGHRLLVVAVGGPGGSGLAEMTEARLDEIDPSIRAAYDIVFFDQRGVGASDGLHCPTAARHTDASSSDADARKFAEACVQETGHASADMAVYATSQAAEDVDAIRRALGYDRFVLYGESYGTRLAQVYAAHHADRLDALILDGAIDPALDGPAFWAESAAGFDHALRETLDACTGDQACTDDLHGKDPLVVVRDLLRFAEHGSTISIPSADGVVTDEEVFKGELASAIEGALYTEGGRADLQRAIAAAANGDTTLLGRLVLVDRETSSGERSRSGPASGGHSVASYFAIECADFDYAPGEAGARAFEAARDTAKEAGRILDTVVSQDLPCAYWPIHGAPLGPTALPDVPTLVLAATADPVTPQGNADRIVARLPHAALVLTLGGPHVTWRAGAECVEGAVKALLLDGRLPDGKTRCPARTTDTYVELSPAESIGISAIDVLDIVYRETFSLPENALWDGTTSVTMGCAFGGTIKIEAAGTASRITYVYQACGIFRDLTVNGEASFDQESGAFHFEGTLGLDKLVFDEDAHGHRTVDGDWKGQKVHDRD